MIICMKESHELYFFPWVYILSYIMSGRNPLRALFGGSRYGKKTAGTVLVDAQGNVSEVAADEKVPDGRYDNFEAEPADAHAVNQVMGVDDVHGNRILAPEGVVEEQRRIYEQIQRENKREVPAAARNDNHREIDRIRREAREEANRAREEATRAREEAARNREEAALARRERDSSRSVAKFLTASLVNKPYSSYSDYEKDRLKSENRLLWEAYEKKKLRDENAALERATREKTSFASRPVRQSPVKRSPVKRSTSKRRSSAKRSPSGKKSSAKRSPVRKSTSKRSSSGKKSPSRKLRGKRGKGDDNPLLSIFGSGPVNNAASLATMATKAVANGAQTFANTAQSVAGVVSNARNITQNTMNTLGNEVQAASQSGAWDDEIHTGKGEDTNHLKNLC